MGCKKNLTSKERWAIIKLQSDEITKLEIGNKLNRDQRTIRKEIEIIDKIKKKKKMSLRLLQKEIWEKSEE